MIFFKQKLFIGFLLFISSTTWAQVFEINFPKDGIRLDSIVMINTISSNRSYNVIVQIGNEDSSFITIRQKQNLDTINIIPLFPDDNWNIPETYTLFEFKDINLDGYSDLFVLSGIGWRYWEKAYDIWLFDKKNQKFNYSKEFTDKVYTDYQLDEKNKTITSNWYGWMDHYEYGSDIYKINGSNLILIERISQKFVDVNKYIWKHEKLIKGKLEVIKQIYKNEGEKEIMDEK